MACLKLLISLNDLASRVIFIMGNSVLFVPSVIGNSLVIYLVWRKVTLRSPTYLLMSFLALSDLLTSLFGQTSNCISLTILKDLPCNLFRAIAFMNSANCVSSLLLLSLIARDRYLRVSKRQNYLDHTSKRFAITASIACFILGMIVASLFTFDNHIIQISSTFAAAVIGSSSFIFICLKSRKITRIVQDHTKQMKAMQENAFASEKIALTRSIKVEKSVNRSIFSVIILFFVSWTPAIILMTIFTAHQVLNEPIADGYRIAFVWGTTVVYLKGALNHIIYSYRCDAIGREIRRMVGKVTRRHVVAPSTSQGKKVASAEDMAGRPKKLGITTKAWQLN